MNCLLFTGKGQFNGESSAFAQNAVYGNTAVMLFYYFLGNRQPQPAAFCFSLAARNTVEALKEVLDGFWRDTLPGVGDSQINVVLLTTPDDG